MLLQNILARLAQKKAEIEAQDIEAYVQARLAEIADKIRKEAEQAKAYELKVVEIKIETITDAIAEQEAELHKVEAETEV